jgi:signal peptidase I
MNAAPPALTAVQLVVLLYILSLIRGFIHFYPRLGLREDRKKSWNETLDSIIIAGIVALILIHFVVRSFFIPSGSMIPTLQVKDYILVNKFIYRFCKPARGDIVVFHPPPKAQSGGKDYIKRVVGLPGETIEVRDRAAYINGERLSEPYIERERAPDYMMPQRVIPPDSVYVLGDNRNNSQDSHLWEELPIRNIVGKAFLIFWPPCRMQVLTGRPERADQ